MKPFLTVGIVSLTSFVLIACQSKQDICADFAAEVSVPSQTQLINHYWNKLNMPKVKYPNLWQIRKYCEFYK